MAIFTPEYLKNLGLDHSADMAAVKRAYARTLKTINQATEPERFTALRIDYENSLAFVKSGIRVEYHIDDEPATDTSSPNNATNKNPRPHIDSDEKENEPTPLTVEPSTPLPPATTLSTWEIVAQEMDALTALIFALPAQDQAGQTKVLRQHLQREALIPIDVRTQFEESLVQALAERRFQHHSGPFLLAAAEVFQWENSGNAQLIACGGGGRYLSNLLDEASVTPARVIALWLPLLDEPRTATAKILLAQAHTFRQKYSTLFSFFIEDEHFIRWEDAIGYRHGIPLATKEKLPERDLSKKRLLTYVSIVFLLIFMVPALIAAYKSYGTSPKEFEGCDAFYAKLITKNWHDITLGESDNILSCAAQTPPVMCDDRKKMQEVLSIRQQWVANSMAYRQAYENDTLFRTTAGFSYESKKDSCEAAWNTLLFGQWIKFGDEAAARNTIERLGQSQCEPFLSTLKSQHDLDFLKSIQQFDAWPNAADRDPERIDHLHTRFKTAPLVTTQILDNPAKPWAVCLPYDQKIIPTLLNSKEVGAKERAAIMQQLVQK